MSPSMSVRRYSRDERGDVEDAQDYKRDFDGDESMGATRDARSALRGYDHLACQFGVAIAEALAASLCRSTRRSDKPTEYRTRQMP